MKIGLALFMLVLLAGIAFGLGRDFYSTERGVVKGVVVSADAGGTEFKSQSARPPRFKVRLADGAVVDVATTNAKSVPNGGEIDVTELVTPWGQVWYKQHN
jgi:hypothetical protein